MTLNWLTLNFNVGTLFDDTERTESDTSIVRRLSNIDKFQNIFPNRQFVFSRQFLVQPWKGTLNIHVLHKYSIRRKNRQFDVPFLHLTWGIGEPTATHCNVKFPPNMTSLIGGGGMENWGETLRTVQTNMWKFNKYDMNYV